MNNYMINGFAFGWDPDCMVPTYKLQYDWGWITKDTVKEYCKRGYFTKKGYQTITGEDYVEE